MILNKTKQVIPETLVVERDGILGRSREEEHQVTAARVDSSEKNNTIIAEFLVLINT
jgi:hypothetical protein